MRPSLLVAFLLFSMLISHVQGIRLNKGIIHHEGHRVDAVKLQDEHHSGEIRKLIFKVTSNPSTISTAITSKVGAKDLQKEGNKPKASRNKLGFGVKDKSLSIDSMVESAHRYTTSEQYPDVIDLTGMDYSPAKRKPPIHN